MSETPPSIPPLSRSALTARLRAAGCVFAEDEADLMFSAAGTAGELAAMAERRAAGFPLEHVVGRAEFCGLPVAVEAGVFVPRRRSEFLVRCAAALTRPGALVADLCCGSGALGAALSAAVTRPGQDPYGAVELHAADVDPVAVRCARRNVAAVGGHVRQGDLWEGLPPELIGRIEVLLANVPYVPTDSLRLLPAEARLHEPRAALDGGSDGLDTLRRVAAAAPRWLAPGGHLLVEAVETQVDAASAAMEDSGLTVRVDRCEELGATVLTGTKPGLPQQPTGLH